MKPAPFEYHAPATVEEALELLARYGDEAKVLAGGQSLIPTMNFRLAQPAVLVDVNGLSGLATIEATDDGGVALGTLTRQRTAERNELVAELAPLMAEALPFVAHPQIRNRGTVGGNLAHADPRSELPAVMLALRARFRLRSAAGERWVEADDFFRGLFRSALEPEDLLVEVRIPPPVPRSGWCFQELSRRAGDYALVGVACQITLDEGGAVAAARIAFLSAGQTPILAERAGALLVGERPSDELARAAGAEARSEVDPMEDVHATPDYRRHLTDVLTRRALPVAFRRALDRGGAP